MLKCYRYRIYPNKKQEIQFNQFFGCSRFVWNWALETKLKYQVESKDGISRFSIQNLLPKLKEENEFLKDCHSQVLQNSVDRVHVAFTEFLKGNKGCPNWKSKHKPVNSFSFPQTVKIVNNKLRLPKIGDVNIVLHRTFLGKIKTVTVSKVKSGKYFASILVEDGIEAPTPEKVDENKTVGLDFGIKDLVTDSNGTTYNYENNLKQAEKVVIKYQKRQSKKNLGSNNREKSRVKLAKKWEKVSNIRNDTLHKISHSIISENQTVVIEDLSVKNMVKNHKLSKAISRVAWSTLRNYLSYKAEQIGKNVIVIGRFEPSSKLCSECGLINKELELKDRKWKCECGAEHLRDVNAAKNIRKMGLTKYNL